MAISRPVCTKLWHEKFFCDEMNIIDKLMYIYLRTNPNFDQLGIYKLPIRVIAIETNLSIDEVKDCLNRLENNYSVIKYSYETEEIAILDYYEEGIISEKITFKSCFNNISKKVKDKNLVLEMYKKSLSIIDDREIFNFVQEKLKECCIKCKLLEKEQDKSNDNSIQQNNIEIYQQQNENYDYEIEQIMKGA